MQNKVIILTRGIQGSGKSTWAKSWVEEDPLNRIRYNNDDLRTMQGVYWPKDSKALDKKEKCVKAIKEMIIELYMSKGYDIVVDNMNLNPKEYAYFKELSDKFNNKQSAYNYTVEFRDFFTPLEVCIERDANRANPIGAKVIKETYKRYSSLIADCLIKNEIKRKEESVNYQHKNTLPRAVVFDIDGTLSLNVTKRPYYGEGAGDGMINDAPVDEIIRAANVYKQAGYKILILTGRLDNESEMSGTYDWLKTHLVPFDKIYMRPDGVFIPADKFKKDVMGKILEEYYVEVVYEDNVKNVKTLREMGLTVLQVNDGQY